MSSKHKRLRPAGRRGNQVLPGAKPVSDRRQPLALLLFLGIGIVGAAVWFATNSWRRSEPVPVRIPSPSVDTSSNLPPGSPRAERAASPASFDPAFMTLLNRGNELLTQDKLPEAVEAFTEAMKMNPEDEDVHYNLGLAFARLGKFDESIKQYQEALRILPDYVEAHNNLGNVLMRAGRTGEAIPHFEAALKIMPDYASAHNNLGTALQKSGRTQEALVHFQQAVKCSPDYVEAHFNVGTSLLQAGQLKEAQASFETVLRLRPDFEPAKKAIEMIGAKQPGGVPAR
jgi:tetratricopeptide (TPR) repeat protein